MESFLWGIRAHDGFQLAWPIFLTLTICLSLTQIDFTLLLGRWFAGHALGNADPFTPAGPGERPSGLVVIPSLLRDEDDFTAIATTVESCAANGYPAEIVIIASVDGRTEKPELYRRLSAWVSALERPANVHIYVAGTETRLGKMMAVEAGVEHMRELVRSGAHAEFPTVYFSIDGDGTLSEHALERLAAKLTTPHPLTGNMRRVVSGKICIRPDLFWRGWRALFTVEGLIYMNVAREFLVSNVSRYNWKILPQIGIPGALYCTWGDLIQKAPFYMGFMKTIQFKDLLKWFLGGGPPKFSESQAASCPEALTGASDDTCIAFIASIASWKDGKLSYDAPATPLHALGRVFRGYLLERSHDYEPEARVFTYTPSTLRGLWRQRVRWNASRFECGGRFWRAFWFHWEIGAPVATQLAMVLTTVLEMTAYYVLLPYACVGNSHGAVLGYFIGYAGQTIAYTLYTLAALALERDYRRYWRVLLCLPIASLYCITINFFGCAYGVIRDLLIFGNATNFAPEWTLMKSGCKRVALLFRVRRFMALCVRSVVYGDVPFGGFWLGWEETPFTPSGFSGWTTGKKPRAIVPRPDLAGLLARLVLPLRWGKLPALATAPADHPHVLAEQSPAPLGEERLSAPILLATRRVVQLHAANSTQLEATIDREAA